MPHGCDHVSGEGVSGKAGAPPKRSYWMMGRKEICWFAVAFQSKRAQCWLSLTGVEALKRKPAVLSRRPGWLSPTVKSLAGYLAAAAASAAVASGFTPPSSGKTVERLAAV